MKDFLEYLLPYLADHPEKVSVVQSLDAAGLTSYQLSVDPLDMGKVIGRGGRIIKAIRDLTKILAVKQNTKVNVTLLEV